MILRPGVIAGSRNRLFLTCAGLGLCFLFFYGAQVWRRRDAFPPPALKQWSSAGQAPVSLSGHTELNHWADYTLLRGYYNGLKTLVCPSEWTAEQLEEADHGRVRVQPGAPSIEPVATIPTNAKKSLKGMWGALRRRHECFLDEQEETRVPDVFAYPGIPQHMPAPYWGDYEMLGMEAGQCVERFGRFGAYGYHYSEEEGGFAVEELPAGDRLAASGLLPRINYTDIDWAAVQARCTEKNKARLAQDPAKASAPIESTPGWQRPKVARTAFVLRAWTGLEFTPLRIINIRALIAELALATGGEYQVHILLHVRDDGLALDDAAVHDRVLRENVPAEFWGITTLWQVPQMQARYPGLDEGDTVENDSHKPLYSVYRVPHLALQWFAQEHPEYDFFWNWEMDVRFTGHYLDLFGAAAAWADKQPRKYLWERNTRVYIPAAHGTWAEFVAAVAAEAEKSGEPSPWGPVLSKDGVTPSEAWPPTTAAADKYEWGVGEAADLITFNPIFDPDHHAWSLRYDITGYGGAIPKRRVSIITIGRYSRRLLQTMHDEVLHAKHTMFPEMFPPSIALHHGLKAVYVPHPVYFDRRWPLAKMDRVFNRPVDEKDSVFKFPEPAGIGEHNFRTSSFYYSNDFGPDLWHRWMGQEVDGLGGRKLEDATGRMCLRGVLIHPVKADLANDAAIGAT